MPDLLWTLPIARWSFWSSNTESVPEVAFIDPMMRRRLSSLSRMALKVAGDCVDGTPHTRIVFASRHGELRRTTDILCGMEAGKPVSPNAFSLSVLNAMSGLFGMTRQDRSAATAVSAGAQTLGYALLEAWAQYTEQPGTPVLAVYADEPADSLYGAVEEEVGRCAVAVLVDPAATPVGQLSCTVTNTSGNHDGGSADRFATQSEALGHCLHNGGSATWQGTDSRWQWGWHVGTA
jgi:hypothetical protein